MVSLELLKRAWVEICALWQTGGILLSLESSLWGRLLSPSAVHFRGGKLVVFRHRIRTPWRKRPGRNARLGLRLCLGLCSVGSVAELGQKRASGVVECRERNDR